MNHNSIIVHKDLTNDINITISYLGMHRYLYKYIVYVIIIIIIHNSLLYEIF